MENTLSIVSKLHSWRSMPYISQCQQVKEQGRGKQRSVRVLQAASRMGYRTAILPAAMGMRRLRSASNHASETKKASPILALLLCFFLPFMKKWIATELHATRQRVQGGYGLLPGKRKKKKNLLATARYLIVAPAAVSLICHWRENIQCSFQCWRKKETQQTNNSYKNRRQFHNQRKA